MIPSSPEEIYRVMDDWEKNYGPDELYDQLVIHFGPEQANKIWFNACYLYNLGEN